MVESPLLKRNKLDATLKVPFMKLFTYYTKADYLLLYLGILAAFINGMCYPVLFFEIGDVLDKIDDNGDDDDQYYNETVKIVYALIALGFIACVSGCIAFVCFSVIGSRQGLTFRSMCVEALLTLKISWFDKNLTSDLTHLINSNCKDVERATGEKQMTVFYTISFTITGLGLAFYSCSQAAFIGMAQFPCYLFGLFLIYKATVIIITEHGKDYQEAGHLADEAVSSHKFISASNAQERISEEYRNRLQRNRGKYMKVGLLQGLGWGIIWGTWLAFGGIIFWYGAFLAKDYHDDLIFQDQVDAGDIVTVFFLIGLTCLNLGTLMPSIDAVVKGQYAAYNIFSIIGSAEVVREGQRLDSIEGKIEFRDVSFIYPAPADLEVLSKVNFSMLPGQFTCLTGSSGSGKSTIASLMVRFYDPTEGVVTLDGVNLKAFDLDFLRANIGLVLREPMLFNGTIFENIQLGNLEASREKVLEAAALSGVQNIAETLPKELETVIESKGRTLSLGQKQKVALARAYVKNAKILIVDSGTTSLDADSEGQFYSVMQSIKSHKTIIFTTSRNYPRNMFDQMYKLEGGKVRAVEDTESELETSHEKLTSQDFESVVLDSESFKRTDVTPARESKGLSDWSVLPSSEQERSVIMQTLKIVFQYTSWVGLIILSASAGGAAFPLFGYMIGEEIHFLIDESGGNMFSDCRNVAIIMICSSFILFFAMSLLGVSLGKVGAESTLDMRSQIFKKLMHYDEAFFDGQKHSVQGVSYTLSQDADKLQGYGAPLIGLVTLVLATFVCGSIIELVFTWKLGLVIMGCAPILAVVMLSSPMLNFVNMKAATYIESNSIAKEATSNIKMVNAYNLRPRFLSSYMSSVQTNNYDVKKRGVMFGAFYGLGLLLLFGIYALCFWYGAWLVREEDLSYKRMLVATFTCVLSAYGVTMALSFSPDMDAARRSSRNMFRLSNYKSVIDVTDEKGHIRQIQGGFQLNQVSFAYPGQDRLALNNVTFDIPAESVFGIWGRSGAGKSTIAQLLIRLYDPLSGGSISVDGVDLKEYNLKVLRSHMALAFQEPVLFSGTIRDNLLMDDKDRSDEEIIRVTKLTKAWEFLKEFPTPLDRDVGIRGVRLSPGQQQQVALTRCLLRTPSVLILDEALSALKAEEEVDVIMKIRQAWPHQTVVLISHNRLVNEIAMQVAVLEDGVVIKVGSQLPTS